MPPPSPGPPGGAVRARGASSRQRSSPPPEAYPRRGPPRRARQRRGAPVTVSLYLASEVLQVFAVALLGLVLLYVTVVAFQLVRDGIRLGFVWPHLLRTLGYPLFFSIPLALLIGVTLGIGRLANDQELSALRAQGVSHLQTAAPLCILGVLLSALTFYLTGWVLPGIHYEQSNLRETILKQLNHLGSGANRTILLPGNVSLFVKSYQGTSLRGIVLDLMPGDRVRLLPELGDLAGEAVRRRLLGSTGKVTLVARESELEVAPDRSRVILRLSGVDIHIPEEVNGPRGSDVFHQKYSIDKLPLPLSFARRGESAKDMANPELGRWIGGLRRRVRELAEQIGSAGEDSRRLALQKDLRSLERRVTRAEVERQSRLTFSLACLTFPLVAFPLVVLLERRGRLTHFFFGNLAAVVLFFPLVMAGQVAADRGCPPALAMTLPNLALLVLGTVLCRAMVKR